MSDNRPIVYYDDQIEAWVYRASSAGRSIRCLTAARQGYDPLADPQYLITAAAAGNRYEKIVKDYMRADGWAIVGEQGSMDVEVAPGVVLRGHLDAQHCLQPERGVRDDTDRMLEVKSMSKRVFADWSKWGFERFPEYATQLSVYMYAEHERRGVPVEATYAVVNRDAEVEEGELELDIRTIKKPPVEWTSITQKILLSEWFADQGQLPICDSQSKYSCSYSYLCDKDELLFEEIEDGSEEMLRQLAEEYDAIRKLEGDLKSRKGLVGDEIKVALGKRKKVRIPGWSFSMSSKRNKALDSTLLRKVLNENEIELDDYYTTTEGNPFLTVRTNKG